MGGGWVSITPLNIPKIPCFFQNFPGGMPPDPPITGWSTCNPLFVLVWIRPCWLSRLKHAKNGKISLIFLEKFCPTCYQLRFIETGLLAIGQNITITLLICLFSFIRQGWHRTKFELIRVKPLQTLYYPCNLLGCLRRVSTIHSILFYLSLKK